MQTSSAVLESLDPAIYLTGDAVGEAYACDWTRANPVLPAVVFRPKTTQQVSEILAACHANDQPIVIQGGRTGLAGGATPRAGEHSLSLELMNQLIEFDRDGMTITVGAGMPLQVIQDTAAAEGLEFSMDLGARGSCQAGGIVSTNAGGNQVIQHGMTRSLILGLTAVLADGTIIEADNKLLKNNAGYDLKQLFIGTEGTLGVVTQVTFRLNPSKPASASALCACADFPAVIKLLRHCGQTLPVVSAFEVMWRGYFDVAVEATGKPNPLSETAPFSVLIQTEGSNDSSLSDDLERCFEQALERELVTDGVLASSLADSQRLWELRDAIGDIMPTMEHLAVFDVGIPLAAMDRVASAIERDLGQELDGCRTLLFGHIGDGNLHVVASTGRAEDKATIEAIVYRHTASANGSVSAEHGIGTLKKRWLPQSRSPAEIALMKSLKQAMDPKNILNPGRVVDS
ncbi:MAG: FAD-binding oxidoreductase [Pseudomonadota bacterium]